MDRRTTLRGVLALLLLVSAGLFAWGTALERHHVDAAQHEATAPTSGETGGESGGESHPSESSSPTAGEPTGSTETVGGVNLEATWLIAAALLASLALAFAAWRSRAPAVLLLIVAFGLLLAALDLREVIHQTHEGRSSLVALSAIVLALHVAVAGVAIAVWRTGHEREAVPV
jgi:hypothetical protein